MRQRGRKPETELKQDLGDRHLSSKQPSAAVERAEFCLEDQRGKIWYPTAQIMDARETDLTLEKKYNQMEIGQAEKVSRSYLQIVPRALPHPPMRSQLAKCDVANPW